MMSVIRLGDEVIDEERSCFIVAEACVDHNGDVERK